MVSSNFLLAYRMFDCRKWEKVLFCLHNLGVNFYFVPLFFLGVNFVIYV